MKLTPEEIDTLCTVFEDRIRANDQEAKLVYSFGQMSLETLKWCQAHAEYLRKLKNKLLDILENKSSP